MVKTSKTSSSATSVDTTTPAVTAAVTAAAVSDDVASKQMKKLPKPKSAAVSTPVESAPIPTNIVVGESSVTASSVPASAVTAVPDTSALLGMYADYSNKLQAAHATWTALRSEFRILERQTARELKNAQKASMKKKRKVGNRAPSGFVKPTLISNELAGFLGKPEGSEMARTDVTREINKYIRTNNLQDKENGRKINPDKKLTSLLKLKKDDELTYFNLQRYMSPHFAKASSSASSASASSDVVASTSS
jgi:chromatin remodeling complex protein RSC6